MVQSSEKVSVVIPVFNETKTISYVVRELKKCKYVGEIIIVNDCSTDETAIVLSKINGVIIITNSKNLGKGGSMKRGSKTAKYPVILFCDGDYTYLSRGIFDKVIIPVVKENYDMYIGISDNEFNRNCLKNSKWLSNSFFISGLRAIKINKWNKLPNIYKKRFRIEIGLSFYIHRYDGKWGYRLLKYDFLKKEIKHGFWMGSYYRIRMIWDIIVAYAITRTIGNISYYLKKMFRCWI